MTNPYAASPHYHPTAPWGDSFGKGGSLVFLVFLGDRLLCQVKSRHQMLQTVEALKNARA
jgi:hypothetical protein